MTSFPPRRARLAENVSTLDGMLNKFADIVKSYDGEYARSGRKRRGVILASDPIASEVETNLGAR